MPGIETDFARMIELLEEISKKLDRPQCQCSYEDLNKFGVLLAGDDVEGEVSCP
jgi:hypothetical protein